MPSLETLRLYQFYLGRLADLFMKAYARRMGLRTTKCTLGLSSIKLLLAQHFAYAANVADVVLDYMGEDTYVVEIYDNKLSELIEHRSRRT